MNGHSEHRAAGSAVVGIDNFTVDAGGGTDGVSESSSWTRCAEIVAEEQVRGADESDPPADY
jgi:hypothetical protein